MVTQAPRGYFKSRSLFDVLATLFTIALAREGFLGSTLFARFQIKGVSLDLLNNIFLLDLAFKTTQRAFKRFAILYHYFSQWKIHPQFLLN